MEKNTKRACDLVLETQEEFIRIRCGVERLLLPVVQSYGLTTTQVTVLNLIKKHERITVSQLFKTLDFNQGNMSSICKKLEADGFIVKKKCQKDERKSYLALTEKALNALDGIDKFFTVDEDECWISEEELAEAEEAISVLRRAAKKINEKLAAATNEKSEGENNA